MLLKDISLKSPQENILFDEVLLHLAEQDQKREVLRFWESTQCFVVLGRIGKQQDDVNEKNVIQDRIPVLRRASGGGTVLQGQGCLNYSLVLSKARGSDITDLRKSYQFILGKIVNALNRLDIEAEYHPISDIALKSNQKKISGNAQKRSRKFILHHGTILYDFDLKLIERYLNMPIDVPEYRQGRSHLDFVANVNLPVEDMKTSIREVFGVDCGEKTLNGNEKEILQLLLDQRKLYSHLTSKS